MSVPEFLESLAQLHGRVLNAPAVRLFLNALSKYDENEVLLALDRCASELRSFPTPADVIERIPSGHPETEEAWALVPKTEDESALMTEPMSTAFWACYSLLETDQVAARMTFKEVYKKEVSKAIAAGIKPKWSFTQGHDKRRAVTVLQNGVYKNRISAAHAQSLLPELPIKGVIPGQLAHSVRNLLPPAFKNSEKDKK